MNAHNAFLYEVGRPAPPRARGPLSGVRFGAKDNLAVEAMPMTCASRHLARYVPPYTATVVERLLDAGAVLVGKTNLDEFACGSSGETSAFGPTLNPRDSTRVPGGSSSGAAAAIAEGSCEVSIGSDTGGSVRCPAAFCGVVGFKPTYGRVSRYGLADMAMGLEGPAPLARDVRLCALALDAMTGADDRDVATRGARPTRAGEAVDRASPDGLRVGVPRQFFEGVEPGTAAAVRAALGRLQDAGARVEEVDIPSVALALPAYYVLCYAEFSSAMQKFDGFLYGEPGEGRAPATATAAARGAFGREVKRRILLGTLVTQAENAGRWYAGARAVRARLAREMESALAGRDVLIGPTMPFPAFRLGERVTDPLAMYAADVLTVVANLARVPAGSVPAREASGGLPVGVQIVGRAGEDEEVLAAMRAVESAEASA